MRDSAIALASWSTSANARFFLATLMLAQRSARSGAANELEAATWGEGVVEALAAYIARRHPGLNGFTRANLFRMRQFYETYRGDEKVAPLVRQLPWSHNLLILSRCKRPEEREFYLRLAQRERWSRRELERQLAGALFERAVLNPPKASTALRRLHPSAEVVFRDA